MKVLVTGAGGQVASALAAARPGHVALTGLDRAALDISDRAAVLAAVEAHAPEVVINAAAFTAVDRAESAPHAAMAVNGTGVGWLADACAVCGARLVQLSTDYIFSGQSAELYATDALPDPLSVYGQTKRAGEQAALSATEALVVRTAWVYAAGHANFAETMLRLMATQDSVRVVADQIGSPTHAASLARSLWDLIACGASGIYHVTDAGIASWYDFAVAIQEEALALGLLTHAVPVVPIATADYPTLAPRPVCAVLDKAETWAILGKPAPHWRTEL
ncbi:MAG: dTDP-4-dehydrorhamnose reductase, partial [Novosphingobium sp.]